MQQLPCPGHNENLLTAHPARFALPARPLSNNEPENPILPS